jgi:hypothetical protein
MTIGFDFTSIDIIEVPSENLEPLILDDCTLAFHLGFKTRTLWYTIHKKLKMYTQYRISKKRSGFRIIHAPIPIMKKLLQRIHSIILIPLQEKLGIHVTAYRKQHNTLQTVNQHIRKCSICDNTPLNKTPKKHNCPKQGVYIRLDLKDFFPSTSRAWVRNYFQDLGYSHYVSSLLAQLLTISDLPNKKLGIDNKTGIPQGSPASGAICNLIADKQIDQPILKYLKNYNKQYQLKNKNRWVYTRYSDDLALTCGKNLSRSEIKNIIKDLISLINKGGYKVNLRKIHIAKGYQCKKLLGIIFNRQPNIQKNEYLKIRAITHNCLNKGFESQYLTANKKSSEELISWLRGKINYINQINKNKGARLLLEFNTALSVHGYK